MIPWRILHPPREKLEGGVRERDGKRERERGFSSPAARSVAENLPLTPMSVPSAANTVYAPFFVRSLPDEWLHVRRAATNDLHGAKKSGTREQRETV